jgi:spore photoproduct lyase
LTDYTSFYSRFIHKIYCTSEAAEYRAARLIRERLPSIPFCVVEHKDDIPLLDRTMKTLFLTTGKGLKVGYCPGSRGHLCCNYLTINLYEGCPIGCSYCIMRSYLNFLPITINVDTDRIVLEMEQIIGLNPGRTLRFGTGETGDSLFFDPLCELSADLVEWCARFPNVMLELKSKTAFVDHLLPLQRKGNAVIGFSLNPQAIVGTEESFAAPLEQRLAAAQKAVQAGYCLSFHFDPIIRVPDWEERYAGVISRLREFPRHRIVWISLGTMRYPKELKNHLAEQPWLYDEFVLCKDGKYRYLQPIREKIYAKINSLIRNYTDAPVYLCMESPFVWRRIFGKMPSKIPELCAIFSSVTVNDATKRAHKQDSRVPLKTPTFLK